MDKPKSHAAVHQRQLQMITGQKLSSDEIMEKYFGPKDASENPPEAEESDAEFKRKRVECPISNACFEIYKRNRCKDFMRCSECGKNLKVKGRKFSSQSVKGHVCMHLEKELFDCRICQYKSCTRDSKKRHLVKIHKVTGSSENYVSHISDHQTDIIAAIKRCFGKQPKIEVKQENAGQPSKWKSNRPNVKCPISKVCHEVHKKQGCERLMECSECEKDLMVTRNGQFRYSTIKDHACVYLKKELNEYRFCDYKGSTQHGQLGFIWTEIIN